MLKCVTICVISRKIVYLKINTNLIDCNVDRKYEVVSSLFLEIGNERQPARCGQTTARGVCHKEKRERPVSYGECRKLLWWLACHR